MGKRSSGSRDSTVQQNSSKEPGESKDLGPTLEELAPGYFWMPSYDDEDTWGRRQTYSDQTYSCVSPTRSCDSVVQQTQTSSKRKPRELKDLGPTLEELKYGRHPVWDREEWRHTDNHETYSGSDNYTPSPEEVAEYHRQSRLQAEAGLQYYNKKNGTNYELVEALDYVTFLVDGFWVHCNFTAKLQMDAQPQLFFAEMHDSRSKPRRLIVINCRLLKEGRTKTTTDGCEECRGERSIVVHPTNGFRRGHPQYKARTLRSRAAMI